jgi:hypothetical protein
MRLAKLLPSTVKDLIKGGLRHSAVRRALKPLMARGSMTIAEIAAFHRAWGNDGFAADRDFLAQLLRLLTRGPVLECGTGGTTLLENYVGLRNGFRTYALEQDPAYSEVVRWTLEAVEVIESPLRDFGGYHWYDVRCALPDHFAVIVCDGPYIDASLGDPSYSAWRYGLLPWLKESGKTFDTLLLDDVNDPRGPTLLARWQRQFGVQVERIKSTYGECAIILPNRNTPTPAKAVDFP